MPWPYDDSISNKNSSVQVPLLPEQEKADAA